MRTPFVHLHLHSEYSLIDGIVRIPALIEAARQADMPAVAITDQTNLFAAVKLYRAAVAAGIKPLLGADLWLHNPSQYGSPDRMVLLAQDNDGYENLSRIISRAFLGRNDFDRPTVLDEWVEELNSGLIALSGGVHGDIARWILSGKEDIAAERVRHWQRVFGDRYYVEVSRCGREGERRFVDAALDIALATDCPVVATNDVRFLKREEFDAHEARVCIQDGRILDDPKRPRNYTEQQYLRDTDEMGALFADAPGCLANALEIARRCNVELRFGEYYLPAYPVPESHTVDSLLREDSAQGLEARLERFGLAEGYSKDDYNERLNHELDVIVQMGFPGYFLIVADFMAWTRRQGIPVGPGRGSGAGSLVAWSLGITDLDPLRYELLFERFLNPERVSMPDFDIDFCMERRDEVINYVAEKYGRDKVSQIITFGSMSAKAVVRDAGRVLGQPYGMVDSVAKLIPMTLGITLDRALADEPELRRRRQEEDEVAEIIDLARSLEGLARNAGKHAGGVVIAPERLVKFAPLYVERGSDSIVTQFDKDDVERIGLVKFDFLGLKTLTILDWAVATINERRGADEPPIELDQLPDRDPKTVKLLQACQTTAVFQLESRGMKDLMRRLQPEGFEDIVPLVALFRPGPLDSGMVTTYVDCKHGRQPVVYPHPKLEPILQPTYGVILYQEQVMQIAQVLAGYSLGAADLLRRAMGKKKPEEMAKQRLIFVEGATERGVDRQLAENIFDLMETFAGYGFNKSHSVAYAVLSYQTAFLKANYPAEFMAAVLSADMDHTDKIVLLIDDTRALGLTVTPPDVNRSGYRFAVGDDGEIIYGLGAIKGVGKGAIDAIIEERAKAPYSSLSDFLDRVDLQRLNKRVLEALVQSGAMDGFDAHRAQHMAALPELLRAAEQSSRDREFGQNDMFGSPAQAETSVRLPEIAEWDDDVRLRAEKETLGLYLTGHPIDAHLSAIERFTTCRLGSLAKVVKSDAPSNGNGSRRRGPQTPVTIAGSVVDVRRRGNMGFLQLDDGSGRVEVSLFRDTFANYGHLLQKDEILVVVGGCAADHFSGGYNVKASEILTLPEATERYAAQVHMELNGQESNLDALRQTLERYSGKTPVVIQYEANGAQTRLELGAEWKVRASHELIEHLTRVPGVRQAGIAYQRYTANQ